MSIRIATKEKLKSLVELSKKDIINIEKGIYNHTINNAVEKGIYRNWKDFEFCILYNDIARRILMNIDPKSNIQNNNLLKKIQDNPKICSKLAQMSFDELYPEIWQNLLIEKESRENILKNRKGFKVGFMKCGKCKGNDFHVDTHALRSSDEGMISIVTCKECGHSFKM